MDEQNLLNRWDSFVLTSDLSSENTNLFTENLIGTSKTSLSIFFFFRKRFPVSASGNVPAARGQVKPQSCTVIDPVLCGGGSKEGPGGSPSLF